MVFIPIPHAEQILDKDKNYIFSKDLKIKYSYIRYEKGEESGKNKD
jgi:hypothetical protein